MRRKDILKELKALDKGALLAKGRSAAEELMKMRFQTVTKALEKPHLVKAARKSLARVKTLLNQSAGVV